MTKVSIKVVSVILFVVMIVGFCFAGCDNQYMPTLEQLLSHIQKEFPEAHISATPDEEYSDECPLAVFFFDNESESEYLLYLPSDSPDETAYCSFMKLTSLDNTKKLLNAVMPLLDNEWTNDNTNELITKANPNEEFTDWFYMYNIHRWGLICWSDNSGMWIQAMSAT